VLGIPLWPRTIEAAAELVLQISSRHEKDNHCISASGAHGLVYAKQNSAFAGILKNFFINLPDGMPGVWIGKLKGASAMRRCYGPDFFKYMMIHSANRDVKHFFCGGNEGVANELKEAVAQKFANHHVTGTFCPPYLPVDQYNYPAIAAEILRSQCDIVWIGLSTPKQEIFASKLAQFSNTSFIITVGAAFDFHTDRVSQAPRLIQKAGLEWLYRLTMEPRRLFKRYFEVVPMFIYYNLKEFLTFGVQKK